MLPEACLKLNKPNNGAPCCCPSVVGILFAGKGFSRTPFVFIDGVFKMTDQSGYKIDSTKTQALRNRVDSRSKRIYKLLCKLLDNRLHYDELTQAEREMVNSSECLAFQ